jgi:hypothetical protein
MPKVSIVVPNYNHARFLPNRCLPPQVSTLSNIEQQLEPFFSTTTTAPPLRWLPTTVRNPMLRVGCRHWPTLFGSQHVLKAEML